jgi:hypothetical protein
MGALRAREQNCIIHKMKVDVAFQHQPADQEALAAGNDNPTSTRSRHAINGFLYRLCIQRHAIANRTER